MKLFLSTSLSVLLTFLSIQMSFGQEEDLVSAREIQEFSNIVNYNQAKTALIADGSPYILDLYQPVNINSVKGKVFYAKFNAFNGDMLVKAGEDKSIVLNIKDYDLEVNFVTDNKTYKTFYIVNDKKEKEKRFFVQLTEGKISLLKKEQVKFFPKVIARTGYERDEPAKYKRMKDVFYIKKQNEEVLTLLPLNKNKIAKMFPNKEVLSYIKKNSIKVSKEEDLMKLMNFIN